LDPHAGSGTTLAVAVAHGREALGVELQPKYARMIVKRMATGARVLRRARPAPAAQARLFGDDPPLPEP
jgi:DNA modification methylase